MSPLMRGWLDHPLILGAVADRSDGQVFVFSATELWAIDLQGKVRGPVAIPGGPLAISARGTVVRGSTLWIAIGAVRAVPVETQTLVAGTPVPLLPEGTGSGLGTALEVHPANGTFYVADQQPGGSVFVAAVREGRVRKQLLLPEFDSIPYLHLAHDGEYLVMRDPQAVGAAVIARSADLVVQWSARKAADSSLGDWLVPQAERCTAAAATQDGRYLAIGDPVEKRLEVLQVNG